MITIITAGASALAIIALLVVLVAVAIAQEPPSAELSTKPPTLLAAIVRRVLLGVRRSEQPEDDRVACLTAPHDEGR